MDDRECYSWVVGTAVLGVVLTGLVYWLWWYLGPFALVVTALVIGGVWLLLWWSFGAHRAEPRRGPVPRSLGHLRDWDAVDRAQFEAARREAELAEEWVCVYFIEDGAGHVKVGRSVDPDRRLRTLQTGNSAALVLAYVAWFPGDEQARACEADLHALLAGRRVRQEWFRADGLDYAGLLDEVSVRL